jgi:hypothetical protein
VLLRGGSMIKMPPCAGWEVENNAVSSARSVDGKP